MTSEIAFLKIRLLPSQGKFRTRLELMAAVNTMETLKELSIEISVVRMELIKQNLVIISFKKHKLGSALGDPFKCVVIFSCTQLCLMLGAVLINPALTKLSVIHALPKEENLNILSQNIYRKILRKEKKHISLFEPD